MTIQRVAIIFDTKARPETTGVYCLKALQRLVEQRELVDVEHVEPSELDQIEAGRFDLFLSIDDGLLFDWPAACSPSAFWAIDTHLGFERALARSETADLVFAAQHDGAQNLKDHGIETASWLPLACDSTIHRKHDLPKAHDVCFVGNLFPGPRSELVECIRERFPSTFVGQKYFDEMARTYSASRIIFNRSVANDVNMRVFEALASGSLLLTNDLAENGQAELFEDGVDLVTYRDQAELLTQIEWYLKHEDEREQIARAGRQRVLAEHTYDHRMRTILEAAQAALGDQQAVTRDSEGPAENEANENPAIRDGWYYEFARPEILEMIPATARRVLDVGCGAGRLGESLKARQAAEVWGIEREAEVARLAEGRLDHVVAANVEELDAAKELAEAEFDTIVFADVLEHLRGPEEVLKTVRPWLTPDGRVIASIPNARHHSVLTGLFEGNWTYEAAGLLDHDHLRFFTRREIEKLFYRAGFRIECVRIVPGPGYQQWSEAGRPGSVNAGPLSISNLDPEQAEEFYVNQYLIDARPEPLADHGLTSIIIVTHNELACTRQCIDSIRRFTDEPYELIVVDNGSTDGTTEYLGALQNVATLFNADNLGFPKAVNQGIGVARGQQVLLLNNDTVVTTGWLRRMLEALASDPSIGLVGPCSNNVSGPQQIPVSYPDLTCLDGFAWDRGKMLDGQRQDLDRLVGFCLLISRELIERIGTLDEQFGIGCFDDDDYCHRAIQAGFRVVLAEDAFVHHVGGQTFRGTGIDYAALLAENQKRFEAKWSGNGQLQRSGREDLPAATERAKIKLSLCMIVRDNEAIIEECLTSIRPWVDEMVVVDTGSTDRTPEICRELGARVFEFPWCDDFSAARNESLKHACGEWIFWMDSDDTIDEENGRGLRELANAVHKPDILGYVMQVRCPSDPEPGIENFTVVDHVKLIRNRPDVRFEYRIHEQIIPSIRRADGEIAWSDLFVVHSGSDHSPEAEQRKLDRDFRLLHLEMVDRPDHPFVLFNLGMTHNEAGQFDEAIVCLNRCLKVSQPSESHLRKAYALLAGAYQQSRQNEQAFQTCRDGLVLFPDDKELHFRHGILHQQCDQLLEAEQAYLQVVNGHEERHLTSVDAHINGFKTRQNLAVVYDALGRFDKAEEQWRIVTEHSPQYRPAWRGLGDLLLKQGQLTEAARLADDLKENPQLASLGRVLGAMVLEQSGDLASARSELERGSSEDSEDLEPLRELCRFLFEHFGTAEAESALEQLAERDPEDPATWHNLGNVYVDSGRPAQAVTVLERSLGLRPESAATGVQLGHALCELGRVGEAIKAWQTVLGHAPDHEDALSALRSAGVVDQEKALPDSHARLMTTDEVG